MNAGSTITSRDSHEVRHLVAERQARSGRPRWKNEATKPSTSKTSVMPLPAHKSSLDWGGSRSKAA